MKLPALAIAAAFVLRPSDDLAVSDAEKEAERAMVSENHETSWQADVRTGAEDPYGIPARNC